MLKVNENNGGRIVRPGDYKSCLGFTTSFCQGCVYLTPERKNFETCYQCMPITERIYRDGKPVVVTRDEIGKNIAKAIE